MVTRREKLLLFPAESSKISSNPFVTHLYHPYEEISFLSLLPGTGRMEVAKICHTNFATQIIIFQGVYRVNYENFKRLLNSRGPLLFA